MEDCGDFDVLKYNTTKKLRRPRDKKEVGARQLKTMVTGRYFLVGFIFTINK